MFELTVNDVQKLVKACEASYGANDRLTQYYSGKLAEMTETIRNKAIVEMVKEKFQDVTPTYEELEVAVMKHEPKNVKGAMILAQCTIAHQVAFKSAY